MNKQWIDQSIIVLYDGECSFCNSTVQWLIKRDQLGKIKYAAIQGELGQQLFEKYGISKEVDSLVLIDNQQHYLYSSAALRITKHLSGAWPAVYLLSIIPPFIRDFLYRQFAKRRIRWFGKQQACMLPSPEIRKRFLD